MRKSWKFEPICGSPLVHEVWVEKMASKDLYKIQVLEKWLLLCPKIT